MEVIVGTYEEFLVGYKLVKTKNDDGDEVYKLEQSFTNHAHCGSVRSLAASSKHLASGGVDESIHLINIKHRIDTGTLSSHNGTITALEFLRSSHLFSASDDGNICIWNTKTWKCDKTLRGHQEAINSLSLHSSGKLLLSVSKDKTLRTWNLIKGRCAYILNLKDVAVQVVWSPSCTHFAVVFENKVDIYDLSTGGIAHSMGQSHFDKRITKIVFIDETRLIISGDCDFLMIYDIEKNTAINRFTAHSNRIKDIAWVSLQNLGTDLIEQSKLDQDPDARWLVTTSSDAFIKIWEFDFSKLKKDPRLISSINTTCRPTCMAVYTVSSHSKPLAKEAVVPELKISQEELEVCKTKIKEKKTRQMERQEEDGDLGEDEQITAMAKQFKRKKTFHARK